MGAFDHLSWKCHICGENRPDARISVRSTPLIINDMEVGSQNIRYCNDKQSCIEESKTFSLIKDK
jgi:hypothetical protein